MECKICNNQFVKKTSLQVYCSRECKKKADVQARSKKPKIKTCGVCKSEFTPYTSLDKFCSANCRVENQKSKRSRRWSVESTQKRMGIGNPSHSTGMYVRGNKISYNGERLYLRTRNQMRDRMMNDYGYIFCERCGITSTYKFEMHHIVYRSEKPNHPQIHNERNLINLCLLCHNWFHKNKSNRNEIVKQRNLSELFGNDILDK